MQKRKIIYSAFVIYLYFISYSGALNNSNYSFGSPNYNIFSYSKYVETEQNEVVLIDYYITGAGEVDNNKFRLSIPPEICSGIVNVTLLSLASDSNTNKPLFRQPYISSIAPQSGGILLDYYFKTEPIKEEEGTTYSNWGERFLVMNNLEITPISINFTISRDAPPGNHEVYFYLFYENDNIWYSSNEIVTIHIKHWYEKTWFSFLTCIVAIITIISFLPNILNKVWDEALSIYKYLNKK